MQAGTGGVHARCGARPLSSPTPLPRPPPPPRAFHTGFQGASPAAFRTLAARHANVQWHALRLNYRSCGSIVALANASMRDFCIRESASGGGAAVPPSVATRAAGPPPRVVECRTEAHEAAYIVGLAAALRGSGRPLRSLALLARTNKVVIAVAKALKARGVPYSRFGSSVFRLPGVAEVIAALEVSVGGGCASALPRSSRRSR